MLYKNKKVIALKNAKFWLCFSFVDNFKVENQEIK